MYSTFMGNVILLRSVLHFAGDQNKCTKQWAISEDGWHTSLAEYYQGSI